MCNFVLYLIFVFMLLCVYFVALYVIFIVIIISYLVIMGGQHDRVPFWQPACRLGLMCTFTFFTANKPKLCCCCF